MDLVDFFDQKMKDEPACIASISMTRREIAKRPEGMTEPCTTNAFEGSSSQPLAHVDGLCPMLDFLNEDRYQLWCQGVRSFYY